MTDFRLHCPENDAKELVKTFAVMTGTINLFAGPTGVGKSILDYQTAILHAIGRPCLGIVPARPYGTIIFQSENEEYDVARAREGVFEAMKLSHEEQLAASKLVIVVPYADRQGLKWLKEDVEPRLLHYSTRSKMFKQFNVDPTLEYYDGDINCAGEVKKFVRHMLRPLCRHYDFACNLTHHTPKPPTGKREKWKGNEMAYKGAGSIEWANPARLCLALEATDNPTVFWLRAAKKWKELGWTDCVGNPTDCKLIKYHPDALCWIEADADEDGEPVEIGPEHILQMVGGQKPEKNAILDMLQLRGLGRRRAVAMVDELLDNGELELVTNGAAGNPQGGRPKLCLRRPVQKEG